MSVNAKSNFSHDPFVRDAIMMFKAIDEDMPHFLAAAVDQTELKKTVETIRDLARKSHDDKLSPAFRKVAIAEGMRLGNSGDRFLPRNASAETNQKRRAAFKNALRKRGAVIERETRIILYMYSLFRYGVIDLIAPSGKPTDWPLNILICCLVEHCKANYPDENHFSLIAKKFRPSSFTMSGWKTSKRLPRLKIADRYAEMHGGYDTKAIYHDVKRILLS